MVSDTLQRPPAVGIDIPPGYYEIAPDRIADLNDKYLPMVAATLPEASASTVTRTMQFLLGTMISNNALYCGIGVHRSVRSSESIVSWLTVSSFAYGPERNPRLVISDLVAAKADREEAGLLEIVDLGRCPALYFETTTRHEKPDIPNYPETSDDIAVFQIQATVPSPSSESIAAIDFSTANAPHGPEYRTMVLGMAQSVEFPTPPLELGSLSIAI